MKTAILQMADQGPAESTRLMLASAGYRVVMPNDQLRRLLTDIGCDTVLSPRDLTRSMGYDPVDFPEVGPEAMDRCDLFCDIKAHRSYPKLVKRWPRLERRVLWTRINGGGPEHVIRRDDRGNIIEDCGDEVNPPVPVLTPNLWYRDAGPWAYAVWPPFVRFDDYYPAHGRAPIAQPVCLIHGVNGWGYGALVENMRNMGVRIHGTATPDGLIPHSRVPSMLSDALCMVHLKSNDAPGYSLYEALSAACPIILTRRMIWRCRMQDLFEPGETCLVFDRETHDGLTPEDVADCTREVGEHLERLRDPVENRRIGEAGRERLRQVMWDANNPADVESLKAFLTRNIA